MKLFKISYLIALAFFSFTCLFAQNRVQSKPFQPILITEDFQTIFNRENGIDLKVELKQTPSICPGPTTFMVNYIGSFSSRNIYLNLKLKYLNCNGTSYLLRFSLPLGQTDNNYSKWFGSANSNISPSTVFPEKKILLSQGTSQEFELITNDYNSIELIEAKVEYFVVYDNKAFDALEAPISIEIFNDNGEVNCDQERAVLGTQVVLKPKGGKLPQNGYWEWHKGDCSTPSIHKGPELRIVINDTFNFTNKYSVVGVDAKGNRSTCVNGYVFSNISEVLLQLADNAYKNGLYLKAADIYNTLLTKYVKEIPVTEVTQRRNQAEELSAKDRIYLYRNTYNNSYNQIALEANNKLKEDVIREESGIMKGQINFTSDDKGNKQFVKVSDLNSNMNGLLNYLNKNANTYKSPSLFIHRTNKELLVVAKDSFVFEVNWSTQSKIFELKKNNSTLNNNTNTNLILTQNAKNPYGVYRLTEKIIDFNGVHSVKTYIKGVKSYSGSGQVFKSMLLPGWGSRQVTENKYTKHISKFFITGAALCIGSWVYSQKQYHDYMNAQNQSSMLKAYQRANLAHKVFYCTRITLGAIYIIDISYTLKNGFKNTKAMKKFTYYYDSAF